MPARLPQFSKFLAADYSYNLGSSVKADGCLMQVFLSAHGEQNEMSENMAEHMVMQHFFMSEIGD